MNSMSVAFRSILQCILQSGNKQNRRTNLGVYSEQAGSDGWPWLVLIRCSEPSGM